MHRRASRASDRAHGTACWRLTRRRAEQDGSDPRREADAPEMVRQGPAPLRDFRWARGTRGVLVFVLIFTVIALVLLLVDHALGTVDEEGEAGCSAACSSSGRCLPNLAVTARRLHDTGRSALWLLLGFAPCGGFVILYFAVETGEYGARPLSGRTRGRRELNPPSRAHAPPATLLALRISPGRCGGAERRSRFTPTDVPRDLPWHRPRLLRSRGSPFRCRRCVTPFPT
jgi:hypothetical protein